MPSTTAYHPKLQEVRELPTMSQSGGMGDISLGTTAVLPQAQSRTMHSRKFDASPASQLQLQAARTNAEAKESHNGSFHSQIKMQSKLADPGHPI